jgi:hypothetical protein
METVNNYIGARGPRGRALLRLVEQAEFNNHLTVEIIGGPEAPFSIEVESLGLVGDGSGFDDANESFYEALNELEREAWLLFEDPIRTSRLSDTEASHLLKLVLASADNDFCRRIVIEYIGTVERRMYKRS